MPRTRSFQWITHPRVLGQRLEALEKRIQQAIFELAQAVAEQMENYARANGRWTDRTGEARAGLMGTARRAATGIVIAVFHTAPHGRWLELAHGGKYAILLEAMEAYYPELMARIRLLVGR